MGRRARRLATFGKANPPANLVGEVESGSHNLFSSFAPKRSGKNLPTRRHEKTPNMQHKGRARAKVRRGKGK